MVLLVVAVLLGGALLLEVGGPTADAGAGRVDPGAGDGGVSSAPSRDLPGRDGDLAALPEAGETGREAVDDPAAEPARRDAPAEPLLVVAGRVEVIGVPPASTADLDGSLRVMVWTERSGRSLDAEIRAGAFRVTLDPASEYAKRLLAGEGSADERAAGLEVSLDLPEFPDAGPVVATDAEGQPVRGNAERLPFGAADAVLRVRFLPRKVLHVVDAASGAPLTGVEVVAAAYGRRSGALHPEGLRARSITDDGTSPVTLRPSPRHLSAGRVEVMVRAAGYAWNHAALDLTTDTERTVELVPGAELTLVVHGVIAGGSAVRVYGASGVRVCEVAMEAGEPKTLTGLLPGAYTARVELGARYDMSRTLAEEQVVLEPGGRARVELHPEAVVVAEKAVAAGVLVVPPAWGPLDLRLYVSRVGPTTDGSRARAALGSDDLTPRAGDPGALGFEFPAMEVGRYVLDVGPLNWTTSYELPPGGREDLRIELPPPVELTVVVVEASSGLPADIDGIAWHPKRPEHAYFGQSTTVDDPVGPGRFRFRVPAGGVNVSTTGDRYAYARGQVDTRTTRELVLQVRGSVGVTVELRDGERTLPWPTPHKFAVEALDEGGGGVVSSGQRDGKDWFGVTKAGRYRLAVPEVDGYEPHAPVEFDTREGETTELVIRLTRR